MAITLSCFWRMVSRCSRTFPTSLGPMTRSRSGNLSSNAPPSFWARHPTRPRIRRGFLRLSETILPRRLTAFCSGFARTVQVLIKIRSANLGSGHRDIAMMNERLCQIIGIVFVHLAPHGVDKEALFQFTQRPPSMPDDSEPLLPCQVVEEIRHDGLATWRDANLNMFRVGSRVLTSAIPS